MLVRNGLPEVPGVGELWSKRLDRLRWADWLDTEVGSELRPHPSPAEGIPVHHIEGLIASLRRHCSPLQMLRQEPCIRHIGERVPLQMRTGKDEGLAGLAADGGVDRERYAHIHRIAQRISHDAVRPVYAPTEAAAFCGCKENVFLGVVEVQARQPWRVFAKGRLGGGLAVGLEGTKVLLGSGHEGGVSEVFCSFECGEEIPSHGAVDADVFRFCRLT